MLREVKHYRYPTDHVPTAQELKYLVSKCVVDRIYIDLEIGATLYLYQPESGTFQISTKTQIISITEHDSEADIRRRVEEFTKEIDDYKARSGNM